MTDTAQRELIEAATRALAALDEIDPDRAARLRVAMEDGDVRVHSEDGRVRLWVGEDLLVDTVAGLTPEQWIRLEALLAAAIATYSVEERDQLLAAYEEHGVHVWPGSEVWPGADEGVLCVDVGDPEQRPELRLRVEPEDLKA